MILPIKRDFNFDGYNDIETRNYSLPDFNFRSYHFLYDYKTNQFVENNILDSLYNIELLPKRKEICTKYSNNEYSELKIYKWEKDTLINTKGYEEKEINGIVYLTIKRNNKTIVSDSIIKTRLIEKLNCE